MNTYDVTVIGSGPGGYTAAIRCAQLGFKTAIIERYSTLGGTCLNVGCIPSKALLDSSEHYHNALHTFSEHGIEAGTVSLNFPQMIKRKATVVKQTCDGIAFLMKKNKIDVYTGHGAFLSPTRIQIKKEDGTTEEIESSKSIIATGSKPSSLPGVNIDKKRIITSTEALSLPQLPSTMLIIGAGVIGLELGSVYARLGTKVEVVEYADAAIASMDSLMGKELERSMKKTLKVNFHYGYKVTSAVNHGDSVTVKATDKKEGEKEFTAEYVLVAVGRKPYTDQLGIENTKVRKDERGRIEVDHQLKTAEPNIYSIGDVVKGAMLAHKAEEEGVLVAEIIAGQKPHINYLLIPNVVYTWPEVAAVGYTEEQLKAAGTPYKTGTFPYKASGRARASMDTDGVAKVLAHKETDEILGVHIIGPRAADVIAEAVVAMEFRASAEDIARMSHAHPTYTEAFREACLAATDNRAINI